MNIFELLILGLALSADSMAASISIGMDDGNIKIKNALLIAFLFSLFQGLMPVIGYTLASVFAIFLSSIDHLISFAVLFFLGVKMIKSYSEDDRLDYMNLYALILISIAVTLDAFTVGITYSLLHVNLFLTIIINFIMTFITTLIGLKIGSILGHKFKRKAKVLGGLVLVSLGIKILLSHLSL